MLVPHEAGHAAGGYIVCPSHVPAHLEVVSTGSVREAHTSTQSVQSSPDDGSRLRCVCSLLDTCGSYINGAGKRRLDVFLVYLIRWTGSSCPVALPSDVIITPCSSEPKVRLLLQRSASGIRVEPMGYSQQAEAQPGSARFARACV
jgi:hypothetical protein